MRTVKFIDDRVVVLLSGGPDSVVAAYLYHTKGYKVYCLTIVNDQRGSNRVEVECAKLIASKIKAPHTLVDLSCLTETFRDIPNMKFAAGGASGGCAPPSVDTAPLSVENMHFVSMMYAVAHEIKTIVWSVHLNDIEKESSDEIKKYSSILKELVHLRTKHLCKIATPFLNMRKVEVLQLGYKLGVPFELTFSCSVNEEAIHCGECEQCIKRIDAFKKAGIADPASFHSPQVVAVD
jgi:7-cyano-7-deazaguanine synthase